MKFWKKFTKQPEEDTIHHTISDDRLKEDISKIDEDDVEIVINKEEAINKKLSNANPLQKYAELGKLMLGMLKDTKNGAYKEVPWFTIGTIAMALLYVLNPLDVIPDFIPGFGYVDDLAVLSLGLGWIESDLHKYLDWKLEQKTTAE